MRLTLYLFLGLLLSMPIALSSDASFFNDKSKDLSYFVNDINSYEIQYSFKGFSVSSNVNLDNNPQEINNNQELENRGNRSIDLPFSWIISLIFMNKLPFVTIIIPYKNNLDYLFIALKSILFIMHMIIYIIFDSVSFFKN